MEHLLFDTSLTVAAAIKAYFFFGLGLNKKDDQMRIDAKVNEYFEKRKDIVKTRSSINMLKWIFNDGFKKKSLQGTELTYIQTFINETRRAELSHLLQILPFIVFFVFNTFWIAMIMCVYALAFNVPLIMVQRYNRFRFQKLVKRL
jgi:glycosyl-4,4'-diaponeurosporenoate acyltransferase